MFIGYDFTHKSPNLYVPLNFSKTFKHMVLKAFV